MRLLIVDDHPLFRLAVRHMVAVAGGFQIVGEASNAGDAFALLEKETADVVMLDIALPGMDGIVVAREIVDRARRRLDSTVPRILMASVHEHTGDVLEALHAGAIGYILKSEGAEAFVRALRSVARGERYLTPEIATRLAPYQRRNDGTADVLAVLSDREREVFRLAASCLLSREIADELVISRKTVDTHLYRIHRKLGLQTSAELVRLGASLGG
jgi:DNA-binding NarL/FixJ family response regulator